MQRLSKGFYLSSPILGIFVLIIFGIASLAILSGSSPNNTNRGFVVLLVLAMFAGIYVGVVNLVFIYKIWAAIADQYARTTPGKAVGFLFIPFFGFYWIFQVLWGFAKDCNAYIDRHSIKAAKLPEGLFVACAVLIVATVIPYLGILCGIASLIPFAIVISKTCETVNAFNPVIEGNGAALSLNFLSGEFANDSLSLPASGLTLGRDPTKANLIFNSGKISSEHARLTPTDKGQVLVEDLKSLNGTFYRQQRAGAQAVGWDWVQLQGQMLFNPGTRLRLADGVTEFEIRKQ
jgi:hypothetical protein